jgi:hypothetical protein
MLGRNFFAAEDQPGASKAAIISHDLWQRRYGSQESIVGKDIFIDDAKYTGHWRNAIRLSISGEHCRPLPSGRVYSSAACQS